MSAPQSQQQGPPPVPPSKPVLSSPGAYMANFTSSTTIAPPTAGIHSVNKSHPTVPGEKPAIAARPIPPPTLPKYSASFSKADRDRNEFAGKIDRAEREKVCMHIFIYILPIYRWEFLVLLHSWVQFINVLNTEHLFSYMYIHRNGIQSVAHTHTHEYSLLLLLYYYISST